MLEASSGDLLALILLVCCLLHRCLPFALAGSVGSETFNDRLGTRESASWLTAPALSVAQVDGAIEQLRVYVYTPPEHLLPKLGLSQMNKAIYFRLETQLLAKLMEMDGRKGSCRIVEDPQAADFFWVPHTLQAHYHDPEYISHALRPFLLHIVHNLPFYNNSGGRDHVFVYVWDNGPVCDIDAQKWQRDPVFRRVVHPMIVVGYYGSKGFKATAPSDVRKHCFWLGHDITLPQWNYFHRRHPPPAFSPSFLRHKATLAYANMYFHGDTRKAGLLCSKGIRGWLSNYMMRNCRRPRRGGNTTQQYGCSSLRTCTGEHVGIFALCPAGLGCWSSRFYDAIDRLALPVIMANGIVQPFERFFDYTEFTVKVMTAPTPSFTHPLLDRLHDSAIGFRRACLHCTAAASESECQSHPLARKLRSLAAHRPWFSWDVNASKNSLKLFLLELHCRTARGRGHPLCSGDVATISHMEYGV